MRESSVPYHLRGVFLLAERIGRGGMGVVYRAVDVNLRRDVAIKALPRVTPRDISRLRREARAMASLSHPNLAIIHGVETWRGLPFLVEEYLAGGTLAARIALKRLSPGEALDIGITLADVLRDMHSVGIIHCDIKPSNVGFTKQGVPKLLDFGLARALKQLPVAADPPSSGSVAQSATGVAWFGTPRYMSPEAASGARPTPMFDLWALSVLLYEAVSGKVPFEGHDAAATFARVLGARASDIREWRPDTPKGFAAFLNDSFEKDPAKRPADAEAVGAALRRLRAFAG